MIIRIKDTDVNYEIYGEGDKTVLILHGWMGSIQAMAPIWQFLKKSKRVVVIDFPGQGGKSGIQPVAWGVPEYAEMIREFMQKLDIDRPDVIGHSFGGRVIIYLASKYTDIFDKIILTDAAGLKKKFSLKRWLKVASYKFGKMLLKVFTTKDKYDLKLNELRKRYGSSDYTAIKSDIIRETFNKVISLDLKDNLKYIESPTLLIWGENDTDTPIYMAKIMEKEIKDCGLVVLQNAGHFAYLEQSAQFNVIVENFLGGK